MKKEQEANTNKVGPAKLNQATIYTVGSMRTGSYCFRAPSINEGITPLNGRPYLSFWSASYTSDDDPSDLPNNRVPGCTLRTGPS